MQNNERGLSDEQMGSKKLIKFVVIVFAIVELIVMVAILYYQRTH